MFREIVCPACGETEELTGSQSPDGIRISCNKCDASWLRDAEPSQCASCGGADIVERQRALTQYSRGTQLSIVGLVPTLLCRACDCRMIEWADGGRAVPFNYRSSALDPDAAADRQDDKKRGDITITP